MKISKLGDHAERNKAQEPDNQAGKKESRDKRAEEENDRFCH